MNLSYHRSTSPQWMQSNQHKMFNGVMYSNNMCNNVDIYNYVKKLTLGPNERSEALHFLSVNREEIDNLAVLLWESPGTITALLSEILSIYPHLTSASGSSSSAPLSLNSRLAGRVCNVLTLFQCVAGHQETRIPFIKANIPMYLYPFLHTTNQSRECECFKLTSLGIIGNLVKAEQPEIIAYLLQNEFIPLCLRILKFGLMLPKIVAAFIVHKILADQKGRGYVVQSDGRLETLLKVLNKVIIELTKEYNPRLSKNVTMSYDCLLKEPKVREKIAKMNMDFIKELVVPDGGDDLSALISQLLEVIKTYK